MLNSWKICFLSAVAAVAEHKETAKASMGRNDCLLKSVTGLSHMISGLILHLDTKIRYIDLPTFLFYLSKPVAQPTVKMKVKLELLLTRTVAIQVDDSDLDDISHLVKRIQSPHEEDIHAVKIVEINDRPVGTSLDSGSALGISKDQKIARFHQLVPDLLQRLRKTLNSEFPV
jgi:hypothetical protein